MKSLASAVGGKTARACDSCVKRRARWYCAADDAFLCHSCDGTVHSANPLARRHERVRLKSASSDKNRSRPSLLSSPPPHITASTTWHHGFTRKARTPRGSGSAGAGKKNLGAISHDLVPEISAEDDGTETYEELEQVICQVPVLDPTVVDQQYRNDAVEAITGDVMEEESCLKGLFPTDVELAEFAADVETLLGHGLETESFGLGGDGSLSMMLKVENDDVAEDGEGGGGGVDNALIWDGDDVDATPFEVGFDYESYKPYEEGESRENEKSDISYGIEEGDYTNKKTKKTKKMEEKEKGFMLRLNYESVISSWGGQGPPWTPGQPPELDLDNGPIAMDDIGTEVHRTQIGRGCFGTLSSSTGREARVSRYREKRRTRLFSKKIRYEVRKLNAEKRPRMKGRFVKRASLIASSLSCSILTN